MHLCFVKKYISLNEKTIMKKYYKNNDYEKIKNNNATIYVSGDADKVYVLKTIENDIYDTFTNGFTIDESYNHFIKNSSIIIQRDDYLSFVNELIENSLIISH